ncbi:MAG: apolipoprotein N-acyltransferase [Vulcanimicrobiaceae bacterium]
MRIIVTSVRALDLGVAAVSAIALALAFPKIDQAWLAPFGAAGLFWVWQRLSWKRAFWVGWFAGTLFMMITFSWITYTVGSELGSLSAAVVVIVALIEGVFFGLAGTFAALAYRYAYAWPAPLAAAAAFTIFEWVRSVGELAVPFEQLGYSQASTPLAVFAAYIGTFGVTFVICILGAYIAQAIATRRSRNLIVAASAIAIAWSLSWLAWPARHTPPASIRVAAIQGNIPQSIKNQGPRSLKLAIDRYTSLTRTVRGYSPALTLWPETVITTVLNQDLRLMARFGSLARQLHTTLVVGSWDVHDGKAYNAMYVFSPSGLLDGIYDKRQLVPFAESFPGRPFLSWLPDTSLIGPWSPGHDDTVFHGPLNFAPLICWESAFADLTHRQVQRGAQLLTVSTDDAWFGETSGPYQHAQIAQLRAIENGMWVLRAASTGISGIVSPDGRYIKRSDLDRQAVVLGNVGLPTGSVFARIGPTPVVVTLLLVYAAILVGSIARRQQSF